MNAPAEESELKALRQALKRRKERFSSWNETGESCDLGGEYLRQIAVGDKAPPQRTVDYLWSWLEGPAQLERTSPFTKGERLASWLRWAAFLLERDLLPGLTLDDHLSGNADSGAIRRTLEALEEAGSEHPPEGSDE